ncbi:MAG: hypothetical protein AAFV95_02895 [Bacteroidota bacterium]
MKLKMLALALLFLLSFGLQNCGSNDDDLDCNCPDIDKPFFDVTGFEVNHYREENNCCRVEMTEGESVSFANYATMNIEYQVDYISQCRARKNWHFSLMSSAYACSCVGEGYEGAKEERLTSIRVITLNDFDEDHKANDVINDLLTVPVVTPSEPTFLDDYVQYLEQNNLNIETETMILELTKAPELDENFQVKVVIELSNGESYEMESVAVKIRS